VHGAVHARATIRGVIAEYLAELSEDQRAAFERVCSIVRDAVPDAAEGKSYGMPAFRWKGRPLLGFRAFQKHLSVTAFSADVIAAVKDDLPDFDVSKGMIRFTPEQPIPEDVLRKVARLRLAELAPD
jgi:uncharacterized protein YdhG (YjbR/CyaY superfamily)